MIQKIKFTQGSEIKSLNGYEQQPLALIICDPPPPHLTGHYIHEERSTV